MTLCTRCEKRPAISGDDLCQTCTDNLAEAAYERSLGECYRGGEAASALAEEQTWIQRNLK